MSELRLVKGGKDVSEDKPRLKVKAPGVSFDRPVTADDVGQIAEAAFIESKGRVGVMVWLDADMTPRIGLFDGDVDITPVDVLALCATLDMVKLDQLARIGAPTRVGGD